MSIKLKWELDFSINIISLFELKWYRMNVMAAQFTCNWLFDTLCKLIAPAVALSHAFPKEVNTYLFLIVIVCEWYHMTTFFSTLRTFSQPISLMMSLSPCYYLRFLPQGPFYTRMHIDRNKYAYIYFHVDECFQSSLLFLPTPFSLTQAAFL